MSSTSRSDLARTLRGAACGATAAAVWGAQQPLDKRAFASSYDDVELLGRAVTSSRWYPVGFAIHVGNGAVFGAVYANVESALPLPRPLRGPFLGLAEHVALWPLGRLSDRLHPARDQLPRLHGNRAAFLQATWRHLLFGAVLGELERRANPDGRRVEPPPVTDPSSNGHGSLEYAVSVQQTD
ncbi:MAG TPA: hypothetical protein VFW09_08745 [Solirubrobacteraceae bacterium]|nr:hypothetical protein [Solirubrobacteraceae bacterium]